MTFYNHQDPSTWPLFRPQMIAHDVGRSRDRSTAVVGGNSPVPPRILGITELHELPPGLFGSARASALAAIERRLNQQALIVTDLSYDPTYAEVLHQTFGPRVVGLQISRSGDGMQAERRPVQGGSVLVYTVGRSYLLELLHSELQSHLVRFVDGPMARRAYQQLIGLQTEFRETGIVYTCPPGQHDDLGISIAMLAWAARHPHLPLWINTALPRPPSRRPQYGWAAFT
jgi:hypothetical protein